MANNLRVFNTNSEYQSADLVHPAVSYVIETDKVHYEPTPPVFQGKFKATYSDGREYELACDGNTTLTSGNTKPSGYDYTAMKSAVVSDCVSIVAMNSFSGFTSLSSVTISDNVTTLANQVFKDCISLTEVKLPSGLDKIMPYTFDNCTSLKNIDIPSGVTVIGGFGNCTSLENITLPNALSEIYGETFKGCTSLTSINIPSEINRIGDYAFSGCSSLTSITVNATTPPQLGVQALDNTNNCPIYVPCESVNAYKSASGWSSYASRIACPPFEGKWKAILRNGTTQSGACTSSTVLNGASLPTNTVNLEVGECVTEISGFEGFVNSLSSCTISDSVTTIGRDVFYQKHNLKTVVVGSGCTSIGTWAFNQADRLESLTFKSIVPPALGDYVFVDTNNCPIYVPASSVNAYKTASGWSTYSSRIQAIP